MIKTTSDTIKRSFLIGIITQLNKVNFNAQEVISAAERICRKASDINKIGWFTYGALLKSWLGNPDKIKPPLKLFKIGNSKLPFLSWSTLPGVNCPGALECWLKGKGYCYSLNAFMYPAAFFRMLQNTVLERSKWGRAYITNELNNLLNSPQFKEREYVTLRLYVDGDFKSLKLLKFWLEIAKNNPKLNIYGYSKSLHLFAELVRTGYEFPKNYVLNGSDGGKFYGGTDHNLIKEQNFYRGEFIAVKVGKPASSINRTKFERQEIRKQFKGQKVFICPGQCGTCTSIEKTPHACGNNDQFAGVQIAIPLH